MKRRSRKSIPVPRGRLITVLVVLVLMGTGLFARAVELQVLRKDFYQYQGDVRHVRQVPIPASRGSILDRNGEPLAVSTPVESIWCNPGELLQSPEAIDELAEALDLDREVLARRLSQRADREFVYVRRHVTPELAAAVLEREIPGVQTQREYRRFYPSGETTAHVLGFTNIDDRGQEGLELAFDEWLRGEDGAKRVIKDLYGQVIENVELVSEARPGKDLLTTIDRRLQYFAYKELKSTVLEFRARSGSVVVLDVATGEVLAMVNQPSYNPNQRENLRHEAMRNRAVTDFFEPGSVIKPFTVAAALESGQYTPDTPVDTSPGYLNVGAYTIRDVRDFGLLSVTDLLTRSSNVGVSKLAMNLEADHVWDMYKRFGFGEVTGSGFPGESPGILSHHNRWREVEKVAISYGYGLSTTPLQLAQAYAAIANGGRIRAPSFVRDAANPDSAVVDPQLARQLITMLETVVSSSGTGHRGEVAHYRVAGKTGTARKATASGYDNRYEATFAGFAPASKPQVVVVVAINDPATEEYYGGQVSAPVFGRIMEAALRLRDIAPDDLMPGRAGYLAAQEAGP